MNEQSGVPTISVSLCTYNGERFLPLQLKSILDQDRLPDEVIICDDGSRDRSVELAQEFARTAPFPVRVIRNETNLGSNRNFQQAIELCTGDLIALSDQDDIWMHSRLRLSEQALHDNPDCGLVFGDGIVVDDEDNPTGGTLWQNFLFHPKLREAMRQGNYVPLARFRFVTGATVMFRSSFRSYLFPVIGHWVHDGWIAMLIACMSGICFVEEPLIHYRRHSLQQVGLGDPKIKHSKAIDAVAARHWAGIDAHRVILEDVIASFDRLPIDRQTGAAHDFTRQHRLLTDRLSLPKNRIARLLRMLRLHPEYSRGANGWYSVAKDVLLPKQTDEHGAAERKGFSLFNNKPSAAN